MTATTSPATTPQEPGVSPAVEDEPAIRIGHGAILRAIEQNLRENSVSVQVVGLGTVKLPALDSLAWIAGLTTLAALGVLEWPVAGVIGVGHLLSRQRHLRLLRDFGQALQEA